MSERKQHTIREVFSISDTLQTMAVISMNDWKDQRKAKSLEAIMRKCNLFYNDSREKLGKLGIEERKEALEARDRLDQQLAIVVKYFGSKLCEEERLLIPSYELLIRKYLNILGKHPMIQLDEGDTIVAVKDWMLYKKGRELTIKGIEATPAGVSLKVEGSIIPIEIIEDNFGLKDIPTGYEVLRERLPLFDEQIESTIPNHESTSDT